MLSSSLLRLLIGAIFVLNLYHHVALAQIPAVCVNDDMLQSRECCPSANGTLCGGPNQGECAAVSSVCKTDYNSSEVHVSEYTDLRFNWSIGFFDRVCVCKNNFGDFDCGRCKFGYQLNKDGSCVKAENRMRKSVSSMSESDWMTYNMRLNESKYANSRYMVYIGGDHTMASNYRNVSLYDLLVWMHHYAARTDGMMTSESEISKSAYNYAHGSTGFLTWHRLYLLWFEREMQILTNDTEFTLSYWNWLDKSQREILFTDGKLGRHDSNGNVVSDTYGPWKPVCLYEREEVPEKFHGICNLETNMEDSDVPSGLTRCTTQANCLREFSKWPQEEDTAKAIASMYQFRISNPPFNKQNPNSFSNYLEGWDPDERDLCNPDEHESVFCGVNRNDKIPRRLHNTVHILLQGTMLNVAGSANDPLFFNHHTMIDCLFEKWMETHSDEASYPNAAVTPNFAGHGHNDCLVPFFPLYTNADMFKRSNEFGYSCDLMLSSPTDPTTTTQTPKPTGTTPSSAAKDSLSASLIAVSMILVYLMTLLI